MYDFATNPMKLQRAIAEATKANEGKIPDEEAVKALYVKFGGLLAEEEEAVTEKPRANMKAPSLKVVKDRKK